MKYCDNSRTVKVFNFYVEDQKFDYFLIMKILDLIGSVT